MDTQSVRNLWRCSTTTHNASPVSNTRTLWPSVWHHDSGNVRQVFLSVKDCQIQVTSGLFDKADSQVLPMPLYLSQLFSKSAALVRLKENTSHIFTILWETTNTPPLLQNQQTPQRVRSFTVTRTSSNCQIIIRHHRSTFGRYIWQCQELPDSTVVKTLKSCQVDGPSNFEQLTSSLFIQLYRGTCFIYLITVNTHHHLKHNPWLRANKELPHRLENH
jgi:hypothetical protein